MLRMFCLLLLASCAWAQEALYVVQTLDESLGRIELPDGAVNTHVLDLGYGCNDILCTGERLYVTNSLLNTVQEIDLASEQTLRDLPTTGGTNPYSVVLLNTDTLAVSCWVSNNLLLLRISDGAIVGNIPVGIAPQGVLVYGDRLFVCPTRFLSPGTYGPGVVMVYDRSTLLLEDSLQVGRDPQAVAVDDLGRLHVVCTYGDSAGNGGSIHIFNALSLTPEAVLQTGGEPSAVSFGGGYAFVAAGGWSEYGEVFQYRLSDLMMLHDAASPIITRRGVMDVEAQPDGSFFVSCFAADTVEHRTAEGTLLATFPMSLGPGQMVVTPAPSSAPAMWGILPSDARITEAYPNPFNNAVRLVFSAPLQHLSYIRIYNILGAEVGVLSVPAGVAATIWNPNLKPGNSNSSGVYWAIWDGGGGGRAVELLYLK